MHSIRNLQQKNILQGFTVFIDLNKIGMQLHKICIYLQTYDDDSVSRLVAFLKTHPNVIHLIKAVGSWELEAELECDAPTVYAVIKELKNRFPTLIKQTELMTITEEKKIEFFPSQFC